MIGLTPFRSFIRGMSDYKGKGIKLAPATLPK
jgi:hypothetical protein